MERSATGSPLLFKIVLFAVISAALSAAVGVSLYDRYRIVPVENEAQRILQPAIDALEKYNQANGRYPDKLDSLSPSYMKELPACPSVPSSGADLSIAYGIGSDAKSFYIGCNIGGVVHQLQTRYGSTMRMWERM
ncbi:MAG: hypothetical protein ACHQ49_16285 [Elusimicrobiota bacterium]